MAFKVHNKHIVHDQPFRGKHIQHQIQQLNEPNSPTAMNLY